jgi:Xaa-Pro aminopeptidase
MSKSTGRCDRLRSLLRREAVEALIVSNPHNVSYLTGFSGDSSYLLVSSERAILLSDGRFAEQIREECPDLEVVIRKTTGVRMPGVVANTCSKLHISRLGVESGSVSVAELADLEAAMPRVAIKPTGGLVETLRMCKDGDEIQAIRQSIQYAEQAFGQLRVELGGLGTEKETADRMESHLRSAGAERSSFETIIAVGPHAAQGHARPDRRPILAGQPVVIDWGAAGRFYKSDLTRTVCVRTIPAKLEAVYKVVLKAQERAIQKIRPGILGQDVDAEARATIEKSGFGRFFSHGTGHGIGLEVHEAPSLRPNSQAILKPGMVVTVEPGIYIRGWGGVRIEDDVLVTRRGHEVLSALPKTLDSILV